MIESGEKTLFLAEEKTEKNWTDISVQALNEVFSRLDYVERLRKIYDYFEEEDILFTSSFGTKSVFLIQAIHQIRPTQPIHFVDTTYHFPETISYKNQLIKEYNLNVIDVVPNEQQNKMTTDEKWWKEHPRMCCTINKIAPLEPIILKHKVWISGLMSQETANRSKLRVFENNGDIIKFHPIIDIKKEEFLNIFVNESLAEHPLKAKGYGSVGCSHCTAEGEDRSGRWCNTKQSECGLHTTYFINKEKA